MVALCPVHVDVQKLKEHGDKAYSARDYAQATEHYSEALELRPGEVVILSNRSATYAQRRRFDKALADAERALRLEPRWAKLHHRRGHALFHMGRHREAFESFEDGLKLDPKDSSLIEGLAMLQELTEEGCDESHYSSPEGQVPISSAEKAAAGDSSSSSKSAEELREKGNRLFREGKHSKAIRAYDEAIRANPDDARCWANRAAAQTALLLEFGKGLPPDVMRSNPYFVNSMDDLTQSLSIDPRYVKAWARKGQLLNMVGQVHEALAAYDRGLAIDPMSSECLAGKAALKRS